MSDFILTTDSQGARDYRNARRRFAAVFHGRRKTAGGNAPIAVSISTTINAGDFDQYTVDRLKPDGETRPVQIRNISAVDINGSTSSPVTTVALWCGAKLGYCVDPRETASVKALNIGAFPGYHSNCWKLTTTGSDPSQVAWALDPTNTSTHVTMATSNNAIFAGGVRILLYFSIIRNVEGTNEFNPDGYLEDQFGINNDERLDALIFGSPAEFSGVTMADGDTYFEKSVWFPTFESDEWDVMTEFLSRGGDVIVCVPKLSFFIQAGLPAYSDTSASVTARAKVNDFFEDLGADTRIEAITATAYEDYLQVWDAVKEINLSGSGILSDWSFEAANGSDDPYLVTPIFEGTVLENSDTSTWLTSNQWVDGRDDPENIAVDAARLEVPEAIIEPLAGGGRLIVLPADQFGGGNFSYRYLWHNLVAKKLGRNGIARQFAGLQPSFTGSNTNYTLPNDAGTAYFNRKGTASPGGAVDIIQYKVGSSPGLPTNPDFCWFQSSTAVTDNTNAAISNGWIDFSNRTIRTPTKPVDGPDTVPEILVAFRITKPFSTEQGLEDQYEHIDRADPLLADWVSNGLVTTPGTLQVYNAFSLGVAGSLRGTQTPVTAIEYTGLEAGKTVTVTVVDAPGESDVTAATVPGIYFEDRIWIPADAARVVNWQTSAYHREFPLSSFVAFDDPTEAIDLTTVGLFDWLMVVRISGLEWDINDSGVDASYYQVPAVGIVPEYGIQLSAPEDDTEPEPEPDPEPV